VTAAQTALPLSPHLERGLANQAAAMEALEDLYPGLLLALREEARKVCRRMGRVTTDDLRLIAKIKDLGEVDPHVWGGVFKEVDAEGKPVWRSVGRTPSTLAGNNGRLISLWALRQPTSAEGALTP
jgi:hypothetical protein